jgi:hypothetical protein
MCPCCAQLINNYDMKTQGEWRNNFTTLNFALGGGKWSGCTARPLHAQGKSCCYPFDSLVGPIAGLYNVEKNLLLLPGIEPTLMTILVCGKIG